MDYCSPIAKILQIENLSAIMELPMDLRWQILRKVEYFIIPRVHSYHIQPSREDLASTYINVLWVAFDVICSASTFTIDSPVHPDEKPPICKTTDVYRDTFMIVLLRFSRSLVSMYSNNLHIHWCLITHISLWGKH